MEILLSARTAAANSNAVVLGYDPEVGGVNVALPVTLALIGAAGSDSIKVQYYDGANWRDWKAGGNDVVLNANDTTVRIDRPFKIRASKGETTATIGVVLHRSNGI